RYKCGTSGGICAAEDGAGLLAVRVRRVARFLAPIALGARPVILQHQVDEREEDPVRQGIACVTPDFQQPLLHPKPLGERRGAAADLDSAPDQSRLKLAHTAASLARDMPPAPPRPPPASVP